jgi:hypothetical protein
MVDKFALLVFIFFSFFLLDDQLSAQDIPQALEATHQMAYNKCRSLV